MEVPISSVTSTSAALSSLNYLRLQTFPVIRGDSMDIRGSRRRFNRFSNKFRDLAELSVVIETMLIVHQLGQRLG